jgi:hypothetical protein
MPYEFGVFTGFKYAGTGRQRRKVILVLDTKPYRYQKFLSDIAGQDIRSHGGDTTALIREVRGWLQAQSGERDLDGAEYVAAEYTRFTALIPTLLAALNKTATDIENYHDFHRLVAVWLTQNVAKPAADA